MGRKRIKQLKLDTGENPIKIMVGGKELGRFNFIIENNTVSIVSMDQKMKWCK